MSDQSRWLEGTSYRPEGDDVACGGDGTSPSDELRAFRLGPLAWNRWRAVNPSRVPDLSGLALEAASFSRSRSGEGASLNLKGARARGAAFRFADLSGVNLEGADLSAADLRHAKLREANLSGADLTAALLDHSDLRGSTLVGTKMQGTELRLANLDAANLEGADLSNSDLLHARLDGARLRHAKLLDARLDHADFAGADLTGANLGGASLHHAKNLTVEQLEAARGTAATRLPPALQGKVSWSAPLAEYVRQVVTLDPTALRGSARNSSAAARRSAWVAGVAAAAGLIAVALVWRQGPDLLASAGSVAELGWVRSLKEVDAARSRALTALPASLTVREAESRLPMAMVDRREASFEAMKLARAPARAGEVPVRQVLTLVAAPAMPLAGSTSAVASSPASQSLEEGQFLFSSATVPTPVVAPMVFDKAALKPAPAPKLVPAVKRLLLVRVRESGTTDANADSEASDPLLASDAAGGHPMTLVVSLKYQRLDVYRGADLIESSKVSSGMRGHETMTGVFGILEKRRYHHSNIYSGAPMPWMQRLTRSGTALHGGVVPGYPASHGCIRLPFSFAPRLFKATEVGMNVVIADYDVVPVPIDHPALPQPLVGAPAEGEQSASIVSAAEIDDAREPEPLRILVTRRTERDRLISLQTVLASMGYLKPQQFTGRVGNETIAAIRNFQSDMGMTKTGEVSDALIAAVYKTAGWEEPPAGHMFVRRGYSRVFDVPVTVKEPSRELGTHLLISMKPKAGEAGLEWLVLTVEGDAAASTLNRIEVPGDARQKLAELVTAGSSFIIGEKSIDTAILPEGDDFMVRAKEVTIEATAAKVSKPAKKIAKQARGKTKHVSRTSTRKTVRRYYYYYPPQAYGRRGLFMRR